MENRHKPYALLIGLLAAFTIIAQYTLNVIDATEPQAHIFFRYWGYFTILTNSMVAGHMLLSALAPQRYPKLTSAAATTCLAGFITVVALVYYLLLVQTNETEGFRKVLDLNFHTFIPLLTVLYWFIFTPKANLKWGMVGRWILIPFGYFIYIMVLGEIIGKYPYPFFNVNEHGYTSVLIMAIGLLAFLAVMCLLYIGLGKLMSRKKSA